MILGIGSALFLIGYVILVDAVGTECPRCGDELYDDNYCRTCYGQ